MPNLAGPTRPHEGAQPSPFVVGMVLSRVAVYSGAAGRWKVGDVLRRLFE